MDSREWAIQHVIHSLIAGSHLYGTDTQESDIDYRGVCLMPPWILLGLGEFEQIQTETSDDVIYGLNKFLRLALDANPSILDILFAPPDRWRVYTDEWQKIYDNRQMFLSTRVRHTFSGYAHSQLKRLQTHREWLIHPPSHRPEPEKYECRLVTDGKGGQTIEASDLQTKRKYEAACLRWEQYENWKKNRNPERAKLEKAYGFDLKHASHLVRLLLKAQSILRDCDYAPVLNEEEREIVLTVKSGKWSYDRLIEWANNTDAVVQLMLSNLPHSPDRKNVEKILVEINLKTVLEEMT